MTARRGTHVCYAPAIVAGNGASDRQTGFATVGWREWLALPDLGIPALKAKVDTGARTSALHTFDVRRFERAGGSYAAFSVRPLQYREDVIVRCEAPIVAERFVTDSGGHRELRYFIRTAVQVGSATWPIEVSLTNRATLRFRMLLGRTAVARHLLVDPSRSFLMGTELRFTYAPSRRRGSI
jgi:hypothetical protein